MKGIKLLIIGPAYRRKTNPEPLPALERYDGIFYRIVKKYLPKENLEIMIISDELQLINDSKKIPYNQPKDSQWGRTKISHYSVSSIEKNYNENSKFLKNFLLENNIEEVFICAGRVHRKVLPDLEDSNITVILPKGGLGSTARLLKQWLQKI